MNLNERFRAFLPVVVDIETGGVDATKHALLEMAIVLLRWENDALHPDVAYTWNIEPHPDTNITEKSIELTHIDPADTERSTVDEETAVRECFRIVQRRVKEAECRRGVLTGHNAHFDYGFIRAAIARNGIGRSANPFHPFTVLDTASMGAVAVGHTVLHEIAHRLDIEYDKSEAHSARYDAEITARVFCAIVNRANYSVGG
ncbi:MAG: ribonuclease T [Gammaproteobacteria bacterium]|nr:ribonuclease T [Gammaproteobacteria bacterium]